MKFNKYISAGGALLSLHPIIMFVNAVTGESSALSVIYLLAVVAAGAAGFFLRTALLPVENKRPLFSKLIFFASAVAAGAAVFLLFPGRILLLVAAVAACVLGYIFFGADYRMIMTTAVYAAVMILYTGALLILSVVQAVAPLAQCIAVFMVITMLYSIVRNQNHIDRLMERRRHEKQYLPKQIRSYNISLVAIITFIMSLGILLRNYIAAGLVFLKDAAVFLFAALTRIVIKLVGFFAPDEDSGLDFSDAGEMVVPEQTGNSVADIIFLAIAYAALAAAVIALVVKIVKNRRRITARISYILHSAIDFMKRLFRAKFVHPEEDGYYDVEEFFAKAAASSMNSSRLSPYAKAWKKGLAAYKKMPSGEVKFRYGYRLAHEGFRLSGHELADHMTPVENARIVDKPAYGEVTEAYCGIKYGENGSDSKPEKELDGIVSELSSKILK